MTKQAIAAILIVMAVTSTADAQNAATLRGFVTDESDGQALIGVNVVLVAQDSTLYGIATDPDGFFAIAQVPSGTYTLRASFIGYDTFEETVELAG